MSLVRVDPAAARLRRSPVVLQTEAAECGLACLAMIACAHGRDIDLPALRREHAASLRGTSLRSLMDVARSLGLSARPLRIELGELADLRLPAILHWDMTHFVVLVRASRRRIVVHDPALGRRRYTLAEASPRVTGVALELAPLHDFERRRERAQLRIRDFWQSSLGLWRALAQLLVVSLVLQAFAVASPFYVQLVVDQVLTRRDRDLLSVLAAGFLLLVLIQLAARVLRSVLVLHLGSQLSFQLASSLFRHLLCLPLSYFEKRGSGDVLSRFGSVEPIRRALTTGLIAVAIDGVTASATLAMMLTYSPLLTWPVLGALALYALGRAALFPHLRALSQEQIVAGAREESHLIETLRAVQSIKVFGGEVEREASWQNRHARLLNAGIRLGKLGATGEALSGLLFGLENIAVVWLGAGLVLSGDLSVGMLFAFLSYKGQFTGRVSALVDQSVEWRALHLHLERLADIVLSPREPGLRPEPLLEPLRGELELVDVSFRYARYDPPVLEHVSVSIRAGESIAVTGPSGSGKSTLVKLMLGLLEPTRGEIRIDGRPLDRLGLRAYRRHTAAVLQGEQLLSGSIADNICLFEGERDPERLRRCAESAAIHDEILALPMQYESLVGEGGALLSAGQRQRVLLARALYRSPRLLFLDEGLSHLDPGLEARIAECLAKLEITRVLVTHRPGLVRSAQRELALRPPAARGACRP